jgi:hypothetical protein
MTPSGSSEHHQLDDENRQIDVLFITAIRAAHQP